MADRSELLRDILAETTAATDTLGATLRAVRGRRWKRKLRPVVALLVVGFAWFLPEIPWRSRPTVGTVWEREGDPSPASPFRSVEIVHTRPLETSECVRSAPPESFSLRSDPRAVVRATDEELLVLAGGQGVGLFRREGRAELLIAQTH